MGHNFNLFQLSSGGIRGRGNRVGLDAFKVLSECPRCCDHLSALVCSTLKWDHRSSSLAPRKLAVLSSVLTLNVKNIGKTGNEETREESN